MSVLVVVDKDDVNFFFLEYGRCRTVARSLHEHKP